MYCSKCYANFDKKQLSDGIKCPFCSSYNVIAVLKDNISEETTDDNENISLAEYIEIAIKELHNFQKEWEENNAKEPEYYPMKMPIGEWGAQELSERF